MRFERLRAYRIHSLAVQRFLLFYFRVYLCKQWQELKVFNDHTALATGVRFGQNATFVASTSMDRSLKVFGAPDADI